MNLEREFAAWVDRRDPAALNRVFDATAGRLLLLAAHVGGAETAAEDLVQATFLAAMDGCETWDRQRPVWPWLAAILQNEARMEMRRRRRRREVGIAAASGKATDLPDPERLAASDEAFAAVMEAIDALPLPYRQVLRLRLVHGLRNVEIAHTLEIPVGTVRAQVHRGLARLRDALPAGVVALVGAWLVGEGALLAQVRDRVAEAAAMHGAVESAVAAGTTMAAASTAAGSAPTSFLLTGGWWTMNGKTVGVVAVGAALLLLLGFAVGVPPIFGADEQPSVPATLTAEGAAAANPLREESSEAPPARAIASQHEDAWPLVVTVVNPTGERVEGADVRVWFDARGGEHREDGVREEIAAGRTAADGTYRCRLDRFRSRSPLVRLSSFVWVSAEYRGGSTHRLLGFPRVDTPHQFTVELKLSPAIAVVGRVLDGGGAPVVGANFFWLHSLTAGRGYKRFERSGEDGRFALSERDRETFGAGVAAVHPTLGVAVANLPAADDLPPLGGTIDLGDIRLVRGDAIRGRVVLGDGTALGGFPVEIRALDPAMEVAAEKDPKVLGRAFLGDRGGQLQCRGGRFVQTSAKPVTAPDGSFVCAGLDPERAYVVAVRDTAMRANPVVARIGGPSIVITVDRQLILLDVRDDLGDPLPGAHIVAKGFDPESKWSKERAQKGLPARPFVTARFYPSDSAGRRMLLSPFGWNWQIGSFDEFVRESTLRHDALPGVYRVEQTIQLQEETRFGSLKIVVVDERGQAWPKFAFDLQCLDRKLSRNNSRMVPQPDGVFVARDLFAGRWRLTTYLGQDVFFPLTAHVRGAHVQEVLIEDGQTTEIKVVSKPAGLVGFRLRSASPPPGGVWQELRIRSEPDRVDLPLHFFNSSELRESGGMAKYGNLVVGKKAFPPGKYEFEISAKGYRAARCEVVVPADEYATVEVELFTN